jgi:hypothetical protein
MRSLQGLNRGRAKNDDLKVRIVLRKPLALEPLPKGFHAICAEVSAVNELPVERLYTIRKLLLVSPLVGSGIPEDTSTCLETLVEFRFSSSRRPEPRWYRLRHRLHRRFTIPT